MTKKNLLTLLFLVVLSPFLLALICDDGEDGGEGYLVVCLSPDTAYAYGDFSGEDSTAFILENC